MPQRPGIPCPPFRIALALGLVLPPLFLSGIATGGPGSACESIGTAGGPQQFRLLHFGAAAGNESFQVAPDSTQRTLLVTAEATAALPGRSLALKQRMRVEAGSYAILEYDLTATIAEQPQAIHVSRQGDSLIVSAAAQGGHFRRAFGDEKDVLILDNLLLNHVALLACRIARDGFRPETLRVVIPQVGAVLPAIVDPHPPEANGARKVDLRLASTVEALFFSPEGRLDVVEVPSQSLRYERVLPGGAPAAREPAQPSGEPVREEPAHPTRTLFDEQTVHFASRKTTLDGILTLPRGGYTIPYPTVLLLQDAGPLDRDETFGPNRPFPELARGLAVNGIASFRYDKRTLAAPKTIDPRNFTVQDEVIDDALAALEFLRSRTEINAERLVILGHGLGGSLAASIARSDRRIAGLAILAGSPRPLDELLRDQFLYLRNQAQAQGTIGGEEKEMFERLFAQLDSLKAGTLPGDRTIVRMSVPYLRDFAARDRAEDFAAFRGPVLILQGGKDYQVSRTDLDLWRQTIATCGKQNVTVREYPELGHLFMPIEGEPNPTSLFAPGHVDPVVIDEIVSFVRSVR